MAAYTTFPNLPNPEDRRRVLHHEDGNLECITRSGGTREDCEGSGTEPSPRLVEDFTNDYRDRLEVWERPEEELTVTYEHDALDRPIREKEVADGRTTIHDLSYVGVTRLLAQEDETGQRQKVRSYSHDVHGRLTAMSYKSGGGPVHELTYAYDPPGHVSMLLDGTGTPKAAYGFSAHGGPRSRVDRGAPPGLSRWSR